MFQWACGYPMRFISGSAVASPSTSLYSLNSRDSEACRGGGENGGRRRRKGKQERRRRDEESSSVR